MKTLYMNSKKLYQDKLTLILFFQELFELHLYHKGEFQLGMTLLDSPPILASGMIRLSKGAQ